MTKKAFIKRLSAVFCPIYLSTNVVFAHLPINTIWEERARARSIQPAVSTTLPVVSKPKVVNLENVLASVAHDGVVNEITGKSGPIFVLLQDIHGQEKAQRSIAAIVSRLIQLDPQTLVGLEGTSGPIRLEYFRGENPLANRETASFFFNTGLIGGPELALLSAGPLPAAVGVEDKDLYLENVAAVKAALADKEKQSKNVAAQIAVLRAEKEKIYSAELKKLDAIETAWHESKASMSDYVKALAEAHALDANRFTQLALYARAVAMEGKLAQDQIEAERKKIFARLVEKLGEAQLKNLVALGASVGSGSVSQVDFLRQFEGYLAKAGLNWSDAPVYKTYADYVFLVDRIKANVLLDEIAAFTNEAWMAVAETPVQKTLYQESAELSLTKKLVDLTLTTAEWRRLKGAAAASELEPFGRFYELAEARNEALAQNFLASAASHRISVLVAGGFHTDGLKPYLQKHGGVVITVTPKMIETAAGNEYLSIFARGEMSLDRVYESQKISLVKSPRVASLTSPDSTRSLQIVSRCVNAAVHEAIEENRFHGELSVGVKIPNVDKTITVRIDKAGKSSGDLSGTTDGGRAISIDIQQDMRAGIWSVVSALLKSMGLNWVASTTEKTGKAVRILKQALTADEEDIVDMAIKQSFEEKATRSQIIKLHPHDKKYYEFDPFGVLTKKNVTIYLIPGLIKKIETNARELDVEAPSDLLVHPGHNGNGGAGNLYFDKDRAEAYIRVFAKARDLRGRIAEHELVHLEHPDWSEEQVLEKAPLPDLSIFKSLLEPGFDEQAHRKQAIRKAPKTTPAALDNAAKKQRRKERIDRRHARRMARLLATPAAEVVEVVQTMTESILVVEATVEEPVNWKPLKGPFYAVLETERVKKQQYYRMPKGVERLENQPIEGMRKNIIELAKKGKRVLAVVYHGSEEDAVKHEVRKGTGIDWHILVLPDGHRQAKDHISEAQRNDRGWVATGNDSLEMRNEASAFLAHDNPAHLPATRPERTVISTFLHNYENAQADQNLKRVPWLLTELVEVKFLMEKISARPRPSVAKPLSAVEQVAASHLNGESSHAPAKVFDPATFKEIKGWKPKTGKWYGVLSTDGVAQISNSYLHWDSAVVGNRLYSNVSVSDLQKTLEQLADSGIRVLVVVADPSRISEIKDIVSELPWKIHVLSGKEGYHSEIHRLNSMVLRQVAKTDTAWVATPEEVKQLLHEISETLQSPDMGTGEQIHLLGKFQKTFQSINDRRGENSPYLDRWLRSDVEYLRSLIQLIRHNEQTKQPAEPPTFILGPDVNLDAPISSLGLPFSDTPRQQLERIAGITTIGQLLAISPENLASLYLRKGSELKESVVRQIQHRLVAQRIAVWGKIKSTPHITLLSDIISHQTTISTAEKQGVKTIGDALLKTRKELTGNRHEAGSILELVGALAMHGARLQEESPEMNAWLDQIGVAKAVEAPAPKPEVNNELLERKRHIVITRSGEPLSLEQLKILEDVFRDMTKIVAPRPYLMGDVRGFDPTNMLSKNKFYSIREFNSELNRRALELGVKPFDIVTYIPLDMNGIPRGEIYIDWDLHHSIKRMSPEWRIAFSKRIRFFVDAPQRYGTAHRLAPLPDMAKLDLLETLLPNQPVEQKPVEEKQWFPSPGPYFAFIVTRGYDGLFTRYPRTAHIVKDIPVQELYRTVKQLEVEGLKVLVVAAGVSQIDEARRQLSGTNIPIRNKEGSAVVAYGSGENFQLGKHVAGPQSVKETRDSVHLTLIRVQSGAHHFTPQEVKQLVDFVRAYDEVKKAKHEAPMWLRADLEHIGGILDRENELRPAVAPKILQAETSVEPTTSEPAEIVMEVLDQTDMAPAEEAYPVFKQAGLALRKYSKDGAFLTLNEFRDLALFVRSYQKQFPRRKVRPWPRAELEKAQGVIGRAQERRRRFEAGERSLETLPFLARFIVHYAHLTKYGRTSRLEPHKLFNDRDIERNLRGELKDFKENHVSPDGKINTERVIEILEDRLNHDSVKNTRSLVLGSGRQLDGAINVLEEVLAGRPGLIAPAPATVSPAGKDILNQEIRELRLSASLLRFLRGKGILKVSDILGWNYLELTEMLKKPSSVNKIQRALAYFGVFWGPRFKVEDSDGVIDNIKSVRWRSRRVVSANNITSFGDAKKHTSEQLLSMGIPAGLVMQIVGALRLSEEETAAPAPAITDESVQQPALPKEDTDRQSLMSRSFPLSGPMRDKLKIAGMKHVDEVKNKSFLEMAEILGSVNNVRKLQRILATHGIKLWPEQHAAVKDQDSIAKVLGLKTPWIAPLTEQRIENFGQIKKFSGSELLAMGVGLTVVAQIEGELILSRQSLAAEPTPAEKEMTPEIKEPSSGLSKVGYGVGELHLSAPLTNRLRGKDIDTVGDITARSFDEMVLMMETKKSVVRIQNALAALGIVWGPVTNPVKAADNIDVILSLPYHTSRNLREAGIMTFGDAKEYTVKELNKLGFSLGLVMQIKGMIHLSEQSKNWSAPKVAPEPEPEPVVALPETQTRTSVSSQHYDEKFSEAVSQLMTGNAEPAKDLLKTLETNVGAAKLYQNWLAALRLLIDGEPDWESDEADREEILPQQYADAIAKIQSEPRVARRMLARLELLIDNMGAEKATGFISALKKLLETQGAGSWLPFNWYRTGVAWWFELAASASAGILLSQGDPLSAALSTGIIFLIFHPIFLAEVTRTVLVLAVLNGIGVYLTLTLGALHPVTLTFVAILTAYHWNRNIQAVQKEETDKKLLSDAIVGIMGQLPTNLTEGLDPHQIRADLAKTAIPVEPLARYGFDIIQVDALLDKNADHTAVLAEYLVARAKALQGNDQIRGDVILVNQITTLNGVKNALRAELKGKVSAKAIENYLNKSRVLIYEGILDPEMVAVLAKVDQGYAAIDNPEINIYTTEMGTWNITKYWLHPEKYSWRLFQLLSGLKAVPVLERVIQSIESEKLTNQAA